MDIKDVENLAALARIDLGEEEKKQLLSDMEGILGYVRQIEAVQADAVKTDQAVGNVWREDASREFDFSAELIAKQFPDAQDGFLKVKKIL